MSSRLLNGHAPAKQLFESPLLLKKTFLLAGLDRRPSSSPIFSAGHSAKPLTKNLKKLFPAWRHLDLAKLAIVVRIWSLELIGQSNG